MARPKIFNTAQGAQFTADAFTVCLLPAAHHRPHGQPLRRHRLKAEMAGSVLVSIPPLIVFLIFQKNFVRGIALTGLKG